MIRRTVVLMACLALVAPAGARAQSSFKDALSAIPSDAIGMLCVPSVADLDGAYKQAIVDLGLQMLMPPQTQSLVTMLQQKLPFMQNVDENGMIAVVVMPATNLFELQSKQAIIITAKDAEAMITGMGGTKDEQGNWTVNPFGNMPMKAVAKGNRVVLAMLPDVAKKVAQADSGILSRFKPHELQAFDGLNAALWIDADKLLTLLKPQIDAFLPFMLMAQSGGQPADQETMNMAKENIDIFLTGAATMSIGVGLNKSGLGIRFAMTAKNESKLASQMQTRNVTDSLLAGLRADGHVFSFGQTVHPAQKEALTETLQTLFDMAAKTEGADPAKMGELKSLVAEATPLVNGGRIAVHLPGEQGGGLLQLSAVVDTTDSAKFIDVKEKSFNIFRSLLAGSTAADGDLKELADALSFTRDVETIDGVPVSQFKFDLDKAAAADAHGVSEVKKLVGADGFLIRMAAPSKSTVIASFGGGAEQMKNLITLAKSKAAPLDDDAGFKKVASTMPKKRYMVSYLSVDRLVTLIGNVMQAMGEGPLPLVVPRLNEPLAAIGSGGSGWSRLDILFPMETLTAASQAGMMMMMAPPNQGQGQGDGGAEPQPN